MIKNNKELQLRIQIMNLQKKKLIERYARKKQRDTFVKKNLNRILSLSTDGWPRTKNMKDYIKWFDLICEAKIKGVYSMGSANCDVIMMLKHTAQQINQLK